MENTEIIIAKRGKRNFIPHLVAGIIIDLLVVSIMIMLPKLNSAIDDLILPGIVNFNTTVVNIVGMIVIVAITLFLIYDCISVKKWNSLNENYIIYKEDKFFVYTDKTTVIDAKNINTVTYDFCNNTILKFLPKQKIIGSLTIYYYQNGINKKLTLNTIFDIEKCYRKVTQITDKN